MVPQPILQVRMKKVLWGSSSKLKHQKLGSVTENCANIRFLLTSLLLSSLSIAGKLIKYRLVCNISLFVFNKDKGKPEITSFLTTVSSIKIKSSLM